MSTDYTQQINNLIETVLTEKTFNLEIVEKIKELRELPAKVKELEEKEFELRSKLADVKKENEVLNLSASKVKERETAVVIKERELELKGVEMKWKDYLLDEYKSMMQMVFRNTTIRENRLGSVPVESNGYINTHPTNETIDRTAD